MTEKFDGSPSEYVIKSPVVADKTLGYLYFMDKSHPLSDAKGRVWHHRHECSVKLNRWLTSEEHAHHGDEVRSNNDHSNLEALTPSQHHSLHAGGPRDKIACIVCGEAVHVGNDKFCSRKCASIGRRKCPRPSRETLLEELSMSSFSAVGRKYGVSDNAIRKWIK